jgi:hypothetical protein
VEQTVAEERGSYSDIDFSQSSEGGEEANRVVRCGVTAGPAGGVKSFCRQAEKGRKTRYQNLGSILFLFGKNYLNFD